MLSGQGPSIGLAPTAAYPVEARGIRRPSRLFVFSDGAFEIRGPDGSMWPFDDFVRTLSAPVAADESELDRLLRAARERHGPGALDDDLSIVKLSL